MTTNSTNKTIWTARNLSIIAVLSLAIIIAILVSVVICFWCSPDKEELTKKDGKLKSFEEESKESNGSGEEESEKFLNAKTNSLEVLKSEN